MSTYILYCRAGFEKDLAAEIQEKAVQKEVYGYCRVKDDAGYIEFEATESENGQLFRELQLDNLIFCRKWFRVLAKVDDLPENDRITPIVEAIGKHEFNELRVEYPDTNTGKEISNFAKKFTVPLRSHLKKAGVLHSYCNRILFLFFENSGSVRIGSGLARNTSPHPLGINRLKFPKSAPSRSTLKLEEAFHAFVPAEEWEERLQGGRNAVDLGAAPGGWTWQLVQKGMMVAAIDNGTMDEALMESGQVKHYREDGFKYQPKRQNVTWLVCDMVEKPNRVAALMAAWVINDWCKEAVFNLKLPMKQRYQSVSDNLDLIKDIFREHKVRYQIQCKHLYHDREEVTVHLRKS